MYSQDWSVDEVAEACNLIAESNKYLKELTSLEKGKK